MLYNFFNSFYRNIARNRGTFFINLFGFTLGIAITILIFLFVFTEISFDKHHEKSDRIYRLAVQAMIGDTRISQTSSSARVQKEMREIYPEIENSVKLIDIGASTFKYGETIFNEEQVVFSDSTYFDIFSTQIIEGEFEKPLSRPNTMLMSESCARKYFGNESAIGKRVVLNNQYLGENIFEVVAVYKDMPSSSHFHFEMLLPVFTFQTLIDDSGWSRNIFIDYFLLGNGVDAKQLESKFEDYVRSNIGGGDPEMYEKWIADGNYWRFFLQPLRDIHLNSDLNNEWEANGNKKYVWIFSAIGLFVLVIACINFINLSTAKSSLRAREVGIRKVSGSTKGMLVLHFLGESAMITFISLILAVGLVYLVLPYYSVWLERDFGFSLLQNWYVFPLFIGLGLVVSIINGLYPAFVLSSFEPVRVLKGESGTKNGGVSMRNLLVIIQFAASGFLIISTLVVRSELKLLQGDNLGFTKKNVMVINTSPEIYPFLQLFKDKLANQTGVVSVAASNTLPGRGLSNWGFGAEGIQNSFTLNVIAGDYNFIDAMQLEIVEGRPFRLDHPSDSSAALLNETAVSVLGIENPIGLRLNNFATQQQYYEVVGVIKDFHYESLHSEVRPMAMMLQGGIYSSNVSFITVRYNEGYEPEILGLAEKLWNEMVPGVPFIHSYLEEDLNNMYYNEVQTKQLFSIMSFFSIIVACLGLFGLASFISQQRSREVAVRKVFGASIDQLIKMLLLGYSRWITLSFIFAAPLAYLIMRRWLQGFSYKVNISPGIFIISFIIVLLLAVLTIVGNTNRSARINPADTLRHQ